MNFDELNEKLLAAGKPTVYFARYAGDPPGEYARGDYANGAVSIVDRGDYLVVGTSERSEFTEKRERFASEADAFDFVLDWMTKPLPEPERVSAEFIEKARREGPSRAAKILEQLQRARDEKQT